MPKICYTEKNFRGKSRDIISKANEIIEEYAEQGFELTLRQCYYQFVARDLLPNSEKSYKMLGDIISDGRLAGLIDWKAIVDRTRHVRKNSHWSGPAEIVQACAQQYQIRKWEGQETYCEVWIEKDALIGVIEPTCSKLDVPCFSCRGYVSQSEMWAAARRIENAVDDYGHERSIVFHLGDHDPSGIDMTRDIRDRLNLFYGENLEIKRIALTMEQIEEYAPPPNPAKMSDARARSYVRDYGYESWELDALEPSKLVELVREHVKEVLDEEKWEEMVEQENKHKATLKKAAKKMEGK